MVHATAALARSPLFVTKSRIRMNGETKVGEVNAIDSNVPYETGSVSIVRESVMANTLKAT